jgi:hypothetical protein
MSALTVRLPNSLHAKVRELAARDDISVNQFIASAVGEKLACVLTLDYLRQEAAQGQREDFARFLRAVPDVPDAWDAPAATSAASGDAAAN